MPMKCSASLEEDTIWNRSDKIRPCDQFDPGLRFEELESQRN